MNDAPFEKSLQSQPLRPIPPAWRAEILAAAAETPSQPEWKAGRIESWWRALLWPSPVAWAGVAAVWLLIAGLNYFTPGPTATVAVPQGLGGFSLQAALDMQGLLDTGQIESYKNHEPQPPEPGPRQRPRSDRVIPQRMFCV